MHLQNKLSRSFRVISAVSGTAVWISHRPAAQTGTSAAWVTTPQVSR